jgi:hypothetical protein
MNLNEPDRGFNRNAEQPVPTMYLPENYYTRPKYALLKQLPFTPDPVNQQTLKTS